MAKGTASATCDKSDIGQTSAEVEFTANGWELPEDSYTSSSSKETSITYSDIEYTWRFSDSKVDEGESVVHTFTGLNSGAKNTCRGTVQVTCTQEKEVTTYTTTKVPSGTDENGNTIYEEVTTSSTTTSTNKSYGLGSATAYVYAYTRPDSFSWGSGVATGKIIQTTNGLTAKAWNTLADTIAAQFNWENQNGKADYSSAKVQAGDLVTAAKYNILANALSVNTVDVGDLITADVFYALSNEVD